MFSRFVVYFVKRYWIFVALGATVVVVFFLWLTRPQAPTSILTPSPAPFPQVGEGLPITSTLAPSIVLPAQGQLYRPKKAQFSPAQAISIARSLGFSGEPSVYQDAAGAEYYHFSQVGQSLVVGLEIASVGFSRDLSLTPPPRIGPLPSPEEAQAALLGFLENANLLPENLTLTPQPVRYLTYEGARYGPTDEEEANFIQVFFLPQIDQSLLALASAKVAPVRGMVTFGGLVQNFDFEFPLSGLEPVGAVSLKNNDQVRLGLFTEGQVVFIEGGYEEFDLLQYKNVVLTQVEVVYPLTSPLQEILSPVFLFSGIATTEDGADREIQVYLPAVAP